MPDPGLAAERDEIVLEGGLPSATHPPSGCRFRTRCWKAAEPCVAEVPELTARDGVDHPSACHFAG